MKRETIKYGAYPTVFFLLLLLKKEKADTLLSIFYSLHLLFFHTFLYGISTAKTHLPAHSMFPLSFSRTEGTRTLITAGSALQMERLQTSV